MGVGQSNCNSGDYMQHPVLRLVVQVVLQHDHQAVRQVPAALASAIRGPELDAVPTGASCEDIGCSNPTEQQCETRADAMGWAGLELASWARRGHRTASSTPAMGATTGMCPTSRARAVRAATIACLAALPSPPPPSPRRPARAPPAPYRRLRRPRLRRRPARTPSPSGRPQPGGTSPGGPSSPCIGSSTYVARCHHVGSDTMPMNPGRRDLRRQRPSSPVQQAPCMLQRGCSVCDPILYRHRQPQQHPLRCELPPRRPNLSGHCLTIHCRGEVSDPSSPSHWAPSWAPTFRTQGRWAGGNCIATRRHGGVRRRHDIFERQGRPARAQPRTAAVVLAHRRRADGFALRAHVCRDL